MIAYVNFIQDIWGGFQNVTSRCRRCVKRPPGQRQGFMRDHTLSVDPNCCDGEENEEHVNGRNCAAVLIKSQ